MIVERQNNLDLSSLQNLADSWGNTLSNAQSSIDAINPAVDFITKNWIPILIGSFFAVLIADMIAVKLVK